VRQITKLATPLLDPPHGVVARGSQFVLRQPTFTSGSKVFILVTRIGDENIAKIRSMVSDWEVELEMK
jgi:hypothetical protein